MICKNCGATVEGSEYCPVCGVKVTPEANEEFTPVVESGASKKLNVPMLVWSIINLVCCCGIVGIVPLIFTILATNRDTAEQEAHDIKIAKIMNIVCTVGGVISVIVGVILGIISGALTAYLESGDTNLYYLIFGI